MISKVVVIVLSYLTFNLWSFAQNPAKYIREGNKQYNKEQYQDAEISYRRAMQTEHKWFNQAIFNAGNALYKQQKFDEALQFYNQVLSRHQQLTRKQQAEIYHNIGNIHVMQQKYREAADAYKHALRLNPDDEETRYNLAWVLQKLQQQNQQQNQQNQNQQNQQDQNQQQNQNEQQQQDNQQQNQDKQQQQQQQRQQMSREEMERVLRALAQQDRNTQQELKEKERSVAPYKPEKDW